MIFERWNKSEQKEQTPSMGEIFSKGLEAFSYAARIMGHLEEHEGEIKRGFHESFEQFLRNPELADRIAINLGGDLVRRFQDEQRKRVEERTAIHQKTVETLRRFRERQTVYQAATKQEQEAARQSQDAAHGIDEAIASGLEELTERLNKWSSRKPKS